MAHFAQIDKNNIVTQVIVVSDVDTCNFEGYEDEKIGQEFLKNLYGQHTRWIKTSYNATIRKNYAGIGYTYNEELDAFIPPKPYESWLFDENIFYYVSPVPKPEKEGKIYLWDEENQSWIEQDYISPETILNQITE